MSPAADPADPADTGDTDDTADTGDTDDTDDTDIPAPGTLIGPYRVVRRLGGGGMGTVVEAVDTGLHRRVAVKLIAPGLARDPEFRRRFAHEAMAQAALDDPAVAPVYAHGEAAGRPYLVSPLAPDGDLGALLARGGPLPASAAVDVATQVAGGLAAAHRVGLVHRDVKPANVLVRRRGPGLAVWLTDFGIAAPAGTRAAAGDAPDGTPGYLAPEAAAGAAAGPAADVYALGCLLWTTLVGAPPVAGERDLPGHGPWRRALRPLVRRALDPDPAARHPSAVSLHAELVALPARARALGRRRRRRVGASLAAAAVLAVAPSALPPMPLGPPPDQAPPPAPAPPVGAAERAWATRLRSGGTLSPATAACAARLLARQQPHPGQQPGPRQDDALLTAVATCLWR